MVNRSSHAQHVPERTCVVCRQKRLKKELLRFIIIEDFIVFDFYQKIQRRGLYVCNDNICIEKIERWKTRYLKILKKRKKV